jgi:3-keto-5-aminohexanoate cleavage enzyme
MSRLKPLPRVMLAPNGARRTKRDHPALPVTIPETVAAAKAAFEAGAGALHAHVRDAEGRHSLDAGLYRELRAEMAREVPAMPVQITTEAAGLFAPPAQRAVLREVLPEGASVALREMVTGDTPDAETRRFYAWAEEAGIAVQHILYDAGDAARLASWVRAGHLPAPVQCIFVLGAYAPPRDGRPEELHGFLDALAPFGSGLDWAACAFGAAETACLVTAEALGGKMRIGFENNLNGPDGTQAPDNAARVRDLMAALARGRGGSVTASPTR